MIMAFTTPALADNPRMPIDIPLGSFRNGVGAGWRLTTGDRYLVLPTAIAYRVEAASRGVYWRFMSRQLRQIGLAYDARNAWRAFAA
jgi:hypothetical protein